MRASDRKFAQRVTTAKINLNNLLGPQASCVEIEVAASRCQFGCVLLRGKSNFAAAKQSPPRGMKMPPGTTITMLSQANDVLYPEMVMKEEETTSGLEHTKDGEFILRSPDSPSMLVQIAVDTSLLFGNNAQKGMVNVALHACVPCEAAARDLNEPGGRCLCDHAFAQLSRDTVDDNDDIRGPRPPSRGLSSPSLRPSKTSTLSTVSGGLSVTVRDHYTSPPQLQSMVRGAAKASNKSVGFSADDPGVLNAHPGLSKTANDFYMHSCMQNANDRINRVATPLHDSQSREVPALREYLSGDIVKSRSFSSPPTFIQSSARSIPRTKKNATSPPATPKVILPVLPASGGDGWVDNSTWGMFGPRKNFDISEYNLKKRTEREGPRPRYYARNLQSLLQEWEKNKWTSLEARGPTDKVVDGRNVVASGALFWNNDKTILFIADGHPAITVDNSNIGAMVIF